jgi:hypothetical protein
MGVFAFLRNYNLVLACSSKTIAPYSTGGTSTLGHSVRRGLGSFGKQLKPDSHYPTSFDTLNLNRLWLHVYDSNPAGIRCYEKVGFKREGVLRQDHFGEGRYADTIVMGLLRDEWKPPR